MDLIDNEWLDLMFGCEPFTCGESVLWRRYHAGWMVEVALRDGVYEFLAKTKSRKILMLTDMKVRLELTNLLEVVNRKPE